MHDKDFRVLRYCTYFLCSILILLCSPVKEIIISCCTISDMLVSIIIIIF